MRFTLSDLLAPHYCCSCGEIGAILCDYCKYSIVSETPVVCLQCLRPVARFGDVCIECGNNYTKGWMVGYHRGALKALIQEYKFESNKSAARELADLLVSCLPEVPDSVNVTVIPTTMAHVRERGYDHAELIAREFARQLSLPFARSLTRNHSRRQRGASRLQRDSQAKTAYSANGVKKGTIYLLIDDVCTTGATVKYGAKVLLDAGAKEVWVAVVSREPLD